MKRVFRIIEPFRVPDGTLVSPFLNPMDSKSRLPIDILSGFSLAAGTIEPKSSSKIHIMPFVTQVTFVRRGALRVRMKGPHDENSYSRRLRADQAVLTAPGTFFQLINEGSELCEVLYILSPAYVFEKSGGEVVYDDSVVLEESWHSLKSNGWNPNAQIPTRKQRRETQQRLRAHRQRVLAWTSNQCSNSAEEFN